MSIVDVRTVYAMCCDEDGCEEYVEYGEYEETWPHEIEQEALGHGWVRECDDTHICPQCVKKREKAGEPVPIPDCAGQTLIPLEVPS